MARYARGLLARRFLSYVDCKGHVVAAVWATWLGVLRRFV